MNSGEAPSATLWMRAASGLEVLTGAGLIVAPSLLARLLFGSDLNPAGEATGRVARARHTVSRRWLLAARRHRRVSCAHAAHGSELARGGLPHRYRPHRRERRHPALARRRAPSDFGDPAHASLGESARGEMTKRRAAEGLWRDFRRGSASRPGRVGKEYEMKKTMLFGFVVALSTAARRWPIRSAFLPMSTPTALST